MFGFASILETCIFAYLGMAIFSLKHNFKPAFVAWSIVRNSAYNGRQQIVVRTLDHYRHL